VPKTRKVYVCDSCGNDSPKWEGRCPACGEWNTLGEVPVESGSGRQKGWSNPPATPPMELSEVSTERLPRLPASSEEMNRVLGGGVVPGSVTLVAGDPGIGKSTLLLRLASDISGTGGKVLYVTGEESMSQVKMRADRLSIPGQGLFLLQSTALGQVMQYLDDARPSMAIIDSIQTLYDDSLPSGAGSVAQIRECTRALTEWAKTNNVPVVLTGHVTKGGEIAGPRVLEHMVDVVLYLEGDPLSSWRLLRTIKNRFGTTNEVGVFSMEEQGLVDVRDPSRAFLSERRSGAVGSVVVATLEGTRPLLVEVQALTSPSMLPAPRRVATGVDLNRLLLVCAVLTRRVRMSLADQDVIVNVTGGLKIGEPAADLGMALAIASSLRNAPVASDLAAIGELGLSGELRAVPQLPRRVAEAGRLGLERCLVPITGGGANAGKNGIAAVATDHLRDAIDAAFPKQDRRATRKVS
jgi:DNA repair protein RadA/Sms